MNNNFSKFDLEMSQRALNLATKGIGQVSPSPPVGCVIVSEDGEIVGKGFYLYKNVTHAEVLALSEAGKKAKGGTAYVSLEPHTHFGRTKPCTDALLKAGIRRVVCPIEDPNPLVSGKGFAKLRENGIEVVTGILKKEAEKICEKFIHWHKTGRPFVHLKMAMSLDGRISLNNSVSTALSGKESAKRVQQLRYENDAILIGGNTAFVDNPSLTDRSGKERHRKLVRVVLDNRLQISEDSKLVQTVDISPTIVFSNSDNTEKIKLLESKGVEVISINARDLLSVLDALAKRELQSLLVEGGTEVAGSFVDAKLVNKLTFIIAPIIIGGKDAPIAIGGIGSQSLLNVMRLNDLQITHHGNDIEITGYPNWK
ncbi:MAG: bifunctional diaminohydroxyphosphoribosylaminopyrimidine deaminase/5-amino-6-(5-phosphoribosylamino)uracil reductase RibD [Aridibacter sp.]